MTAASSKTQSPIRVGVLTNDPDAFAAWELAIFAWLEDDPRFELVVLIVDDRSTVAGLSSKSSWPRWLQRATWDWRAFRLTMLLDGLTDRAAQSKQLGVPVFDQSRMQRLLVKPERRGFVDFFDQDLTDKIAECRLDLIMRHGFGIIRGPILRLPRFGVWSFHHGDNDEFRGSPPGFWESATRAPVTGATIQVLTDKLDGGLIIAKCWQSTLSNASKNAEGIFEQSVPLMQQALDRLAQSGRVETTRSRTYDQPLFRRPKVGASMGYALKRARDILAGAVHDVRQRLGDQPRTWSFGIGSGEFENAALWEVKAVQARPGTSWANPFFFDYAGQAALLFEEFHYEQNRASIAWATINENNEVCYQGTALDQGHHMSFPFVLSHLGRTVMYPQSTQNKRIEVWEMGSAPDQWSLVNTALQGNEVIDSVVFEHNGLWWLFCSLNPCLSTAQYNELHIFQVDGPLLNTLEPHPMNPVAIDSRSGRNGGRPFVRDGRLFRPAQNNSYGVDGYGINVMEIVRLDKTHYEEKVAIAVSPDYIDGIDATHHLDVQDGRFAIDFQYRTRRVI